MSEYEYNEELDDEGEDIEEEVEVEEPIDVTFDGDDFEVDNDELLKSVNSMLDAFENIRHVSPHIRDLRKIVGR